MMRLIDADALIFALVTQDYSGSPESLEDWTPQDITKAEITDIEHAPTIEAEPVRYGKWIECKGSDGKDYRKCSECLHTQNITGLLNFCPVCGAKMDLEE